MYSVSTPISKTDKKRKNGAAARINLRVQSHLKTTLIRAARLRNMKLSQFMLRSSQIAAEIDMADRTRFVLPPEKWKQFSRALDEAPRSLPGLRKLLAERSIFEAESE